VPTLEQAVALGLTEAEFELIGEELGREPNGVELAVFSLMWSEHCAYKHSKRLLRTPAMSFVDPLGLPSCR
jgi:phosphoribosylformylglycinamidine synthase subunit PurL